MRDAANAAMRSASAIRAPFDQEILASNKEGRVRIELAIDSLNGLAGQIAGLAEDLGLKISLTGED